MENREIYLVDGENDGENDGKNNDEGYLFLNDDYRIVQFDTLNIALQRKVVARKGKNIGAENWDVIGYYGTHEAALRGFVNAGLRVCNQDIYKLLERVDELHNIISGIKKP